MVQEFKPFLQHVKGNTYCIVTEYMRLPLYRLNDRDAILIDSGLPREWPAISQVLEAENLKITDAQYQEYAEMYMTQMGFSTVEELEKRYTKEAICEGILGDLAKECVANYAAVTYSGK